MTQQHTKDPKGPKRVGVDRAVKRWVVVKRGRYVLAPLVTGGWAFTPNLSLAYIFPDPEAVHSLAEALDGTVVPVTVTLAHKDAPLSLVEDAVG